MSIFNDDRYTQELNIIARLREIYFKVPQTKELMAEVHKLLNKLESTTREYQLFQMKCLDFQAQEAERTGVPIKVNMADERILH